MPATAVAKAERTYLDADMTRNDLISVLQDLRFGPGPTFQLVALDRQVRDFLIGALKAR